MPIEVASHKNMPLLQHWNWQLQGHENNMRKPAWEQKWENITTSAVVRLQPCKCRDLIFRRVDTRGTVQCKCMCLKTNTHV